MSLDNAFYLVQRGGTSHKVKHTNLQSACRTGDLLVYDNNDGTSKKVAYDNWENIPDAAKLCVLDGSTSKYVTGANMKTALGPPPLPSGNRTVGYQATNETGQSYMAVNNNLGNSYGMSGSGGGESRITITLRVNNVVQWWLAGDTFVFYWVPSGNLSARTSAAPGSMSRGTVDQRIGTGWGYSGVDTPFTIQGTEEAVPWIRFTKDGSGTGLMRMASTKVNGITAGTGAGSGSLPGFRPTRSIENAEGKVLMTPRYEWIDNDGEFLYPDLRLRLADGEDIDPQLKEYTWMPPGYGTRRTALLAEITSIEPSVSGAIAPN